MLMISLLAAMPDLRRQALARHVPHGSGCRECGPRSAWPCEVADIAAQAEELAGGRPFRHPAAPLAAGASAVGRAHDGLSYLPEPRPGEPGPGASRSEPSVPAWAQRPRQVPVRRQRPDTFPSRYTRT